MYNIAACFSQLAKTGSYAMIHVMLRELRLLGGSRVHELAQGHWLEVFSYSSIDERFVRIDEQENGAQRVKLLAIMTTAGRHEYQVSLSSQTLYQLLESEIALITMSVC